MQLEEVIAQALEEGKSLTTNEREKAAGFAPMVQVAACGDCGACRVRVAVVDCESREECRVATPHSQHT